MEVESKRDGAHNESPRESHAWRSILIFLVLFSAVVIVFLIWWFLRGPAHGTIRSVEGVNQESSRIELPKKSFIGEYVSFEYPGEYGERKPQGDNVSLEKALFAVEGNVSRTIAVTVRDMTGKTLEDIPEYQIRNKVERKKYDRKESEVGGKDAIVFLQTTEGYEKTAFMLRGGLLYTVSVNMRMFANSETIERDFSVVSSSIRFVE